MKTEFTISFCLKENTGKHWGRKRQYTMKHGQYFKGSSLIPNYKYFLVGYTAAASGSK